MSNIKIRPLTVVLLLLAIVLVVVSVEYFTKTAGNLPSFFPGHLARSAHKHAKHGLVAVTLAVVALIGAWFTTAPDELDLNSAERVVVPLLPYEPHPTSHGRASDAIGCSPITVGRTRPIRPRILTRVLRSRPTIPVQHDREFPPRTRARSKRRYIAPD